MSKVVLGVRSKVEVMSPRTKKMILTAVIVLGVVTMLAPFVNVSVQTNFAS